MTFHNPEFAVRVGRADDEGEGLEDRVLSPELIQLLPEPLDVIGCDLDAYLFVEGLIKQLNHSASSACASRVSESPIGSITRNGMSGDMWPADRQAKSHPLSIHGARWTATFFGT